MHKPEASRLPSWNPVSRGEICLPHTILSSAPILTPPLESQEGGPGGSPSGWVKRGDTGGTGFLHVHFTRIFQLKQACPSALLLVLDKEHKLWRRRALHTHQDWREPEVRWAVHQPSAASELQEYGQGQIQRARSCRGHRPHLMSPPL